MSVRNATATDPRTMDHIIGADEQGLRSAIDPGIRRLAIVVGLPLVDGVFITLVLAGVLDSLSGIVLTGLVIFGGTAAAAVVIADCPGQPRRRLLAVAGLGLVIVPVAAIQAMVAPTLATWIDIVVLERFAAIVLTIIAIDMLGLRIGRYLPGPGPVVILALLVSLNPTNGLVLAADYTLLVNGAIAALIGIGAISLWIILGHHLRAFLRPDRIRFAGGLALVALAIAIVTPIPTELAIVALVVGLLFGVTFDTEKRTLDVQVW